MKRACWRTLILAVCCVLLLPAVFLSVYGAETGEGTTEPAAAYRPIEDYTCRTALSSLPNAKALLHAYDSIVAGAGNAEAEISVYNGTDALSTDELRVVMDAYRRDHVEQFWFGSKYSYTYNSDTVLNVTPEYTLTGDALAEARRMFDGKVESILASLRPDLQAFELEVFLHDYLAAAVDYVSDAPHAYDAYGAIVEGKAVCEGYAEALQVLLHRVGIPSLIVLGSSVNPATGQPEGHAWNMVCIGGEYYHVDLTWNDQDTYLYHAYFNQTDAEMLYDHVIEEPAYALPECRATDMQYFAVMGGEIGGFDSNAIAQRLKQKDYQASFYVTGTQSAASDFVESLRRDGRYVVNALGSEAYGASLSFARLGREVVVTVAVCRHRQLTHVPEIPVTCTENGTLEHYVCDECGDLFLDGAASKPVVHESGLTVYTAGHAWNEKHEDAAHERKKATDCREYDSYWYTCATCGMISDSVYFERERGAHAYADAWSVGDETGHWHDCPLCGEHDTAEPHEMDGGICTVCGYKETDLWSMVQSFFALSKWSIPITAVGVGGVLLLLGIVIAIAKSKRKE